MAARVSERAIRAGGAAQISGHSNRVPDDRRNAHPFCGQHDSHESSATFPQELPVVEIYIKHGVGCHNRTFIRMHPLETYYLNQAGRGLPTAPGIGPIYSAPNYLQRGHGIDNFLGTLYRFV